MKRDPHKGGWLSTPSGTNVEIVAFNAVLIGVLWIVVIGLVHGEREREVRAAVEKNNNLAIALEQYAIRTIESADAVIRYLSREYLRSGGTLDLDKFVADYTINSRALTGVVLADEQGYARTTVYADKRSSPVNVADREHFRVHIARDSPNAFVGKPVTGRITGKVVIPITRRITRADGTFAGVAMALIEPARFTDVLQDATLRPFEVISLIGRNDGITRARLRGKEITAGGDISASPLLGVWAKNPVGDYFARGALDGIPKYFSYRTLTGYGLVANVGTPEVDVLAEFSRTRTRYYATAAAATAAITGFAGFLIFGLARQRRAQLATARTQARYLATFNQAAVGIAHIDLEGRYLEANQKLCDILGYSREELLTRTFIDVTHPDDVRSSADYRRTLIAETGAREEVQREKRYVRKDGTIVWCAIAVSVVRNDAGKADYVVILVQDVSDRKRAEHELNESEARFRAIFEQAGIGIALVGLDGGRLLRCNPAAAEMLGYEVNEMLALHVADLSDHDEYVKDHATWAALVEGRSSRFQIEKRYRRKDGSVMWGLLTVTVVRGPDASARFLLGMLEDITELKRSQEEISRLGRQLQATMESMTDGFLLLDDAWRVNYINSAAERLLKRSRADVVGKVLWDEFEEALGAIHNPEFLEALRAMKAADFEQYYVPLERWIEVRSFRCGDGIAIYFRDISRRKRNEEALSDRTGRLQRLSRQLMTVEEQERRRLGRELHDHTGANLGALLLSLQVIRSKLPPAVQAEMKSRLDDSESLLRETVENVRDVLADLRPPALDELGLVPALEHYCDLISRRSDIEITVEGREPSPRLPASKEISLFRIAQEALNNATRHAQAARITVSIRQERGSVSMTIADTGRGFPSTRDRAAPASLGLVTMRERAEAMNGTLRVETSPGQGARIIITIPAADRQRMPKEEAI